ncbi:ATP-binding protein [Aquisalimonas sp. APHAB1-3]|uniref:ATP-binding protein n=1 Tax=unclassified Aquisalimonas TaxID=2644645 RepID=UPI0025C6032E|nr:ATP-binding protein [Aquisalimonas sp.]
MTLVTRLQLLFAVLTLGFLVAGLTLVIHHARTAVHAELTSAVDLTTALVRSAVADTNGNAPASGTDDLVDRLETVTPQRHVRLEKVREDAHRPLTAAAPDRGATAPAWFAWLVGFEAAAHTRTITLNDGAGTALLIRAEPGDEIAEAWQGARGLLALLVGFGAVAAVLIQWLLRRTLAPLQQLSGGLGALERGDYTRRLATTGTRELDRLADQFNALAAALARTRERNRLLNRALMDAQEHERRHLARELHDEMGQCTSALQAEAVAIRDDRAPLPARIRDGAEAIRSTAHHIHGLARNLMRRLHPADLDTLGLGPALRSLAEDWQGRHLQVRLDIAALPPHATEDTARDIHLYRLVQEALSNAKRHGGAERARVRLRECAGTLQLGIADNGRGFDATTPTGGLGLAGMRERVRSLGGRMRVHSRPGAGTVLVFRFPGACVPAAVPDCQKRAVTPAITVRPTPGRSPS